MDTGLSQEVLKEFAKVVVKESEIKKDSFLYGTTKKNGNNVYVKFDGSDLYTPVSSVVDVDDGNRVLVMIKNHSGTVLSNITSPAVNNSNFSDFKGETSQQFSNIQANIGEFNLVFTDRLVANEAEIGILKANVGEFEKLTVEQFSAINAKIEDADITYAKIDLANIKEGSIQTYMLGNGVIGTTQIADGSITDAKIVELTANKITAGTLSVERLEIRGSTSSIVYGLNNITEALQSQNVDTLNGEILTPRTITADRIVADAITSRELNVKEIFANSAVITEIFAQDITATGTIRGAKLVGATGSFAGTVTAGGGTIGGFTINKNDLTVTKTLIDNHSATFTISAKTGVNNFLYLRNNSLAKDVFYVNHLGELKAIDIIADTVLSGSGVFTSGVGIKGMLEVYGRSYFNDVILGNNIQMDGTARSWYASVADAAGPPISVTYLGQNALVPLARLRTRQGVWGFAAYDANNNFYIYYTGNSTLSAGTNSFDTAVQLTSGGDVVLGSSCKVYGANGTGIQLAAGTNWKAISSYSGDNTTALGFSSNRYTRLYAANASINTSDETEKDILSGITEPYTKLFMDLVPFLYRWKNFGGEIRQHDRVHCGLGAQSTLKAAQKYGLDEISFATVCRDKLDTPTPDGRKERWGLAYTELIPLIIHMVQKNILVTDRLEKSIFSIESERAQLKDDMEMIKSHQYIYENRLNIVTEELYKLMKGDYYVSKF